MSIKPNFAAPTLYGLELVNAFHMMTAGEYFMLRALVTSLPLDPVIVNLGAGTGTSGLAIKETRNNAHVTTIDISQGGPFGGLQNEINAFEKNGVLHLLPKQILSDSKDAAKLWNMAIDMLIIDADHSEQGCRGDFDAWYNFVKQNGYILFHDYDRDVWPDVKKVVDELDGIEKVIQVDTLYVARKNKFLKVTPDDKPRRSRRNKEQMQSS